MTVLKKIDFLKKCEDLPHYGMKLILGLEKAISEQRECAQNSVLFVERMFGNRNEQET